MVHFFVGNNQREGQALKRAGNSNLPSPKSSQPPDRARLKQFVLLFIGLAGLAGVIFLGGFASLQKLSHPDYAWLVAAIFGVGVMVYAFSLRWGMIVNSLTGYKVTDGITYFFYALSSLTFASFTPHVVGAVVGKAVALHKIEKISLKKSSVSVLFDKFFDGILMLLLTWPFFLLVFKWVTVAQVACICLAELCLAALLLIFGYSQWVRLLQACLVLSKKWLGWVPFVGKRWQQGPVYDLQAISILEKKVVLRAYCLTIIGLVLLTLRGWFAAMAFGLDMITPLDVFIGIGLVQLSVFLSCTPGSLGFSDGAWFIAFSAAGVSSEFITVYIVASRVIEHIAIFVWFFCVYIFRLLLKA